MNQISLRLLWQQTLRLIDNYTMYQVVGGALVFLILCSWIGGLVGWLPYSFGEQWWSLLVVVAVMVGLHIAINWLTKIPAHLESTIITAGIIYFLVTPALSWWGLHYIALAGAIAMLSKYLFAWHKQHIANPAAVGVLALSLTSYYEVTWWIGSPELFIPLVIVGSVVVQKVRKWLPVMVFVAVGFVVFLFEEWRFFGHLDNWSVFWLSYPALFLAFFMLTEPFTMPPTKKMQTWYGVVVGVLAHTTLFSPFLKMTPELALVLGNILFFPATLRKKIYLELQSKTLIARDTYEFIFKKPSGMNFLPGQYLEWMLPHTADARGTRRYFTIASSPTESVIRLACKILPAHGSSFKAALLNLPPGHSLIASQRAGDFLLPDNPRQKIAWIAGGIGVTPFVSQWQYLRDSKVAADVALFYCVNTYEDAAYEADFKTDVPEVKLEYVAVVAKDTPRPGDESGFVTEAMINRRLPDWSERIWYLSGPPGMVHAYKNLLRTMGVPRKHIVTDFFPGIG
jgi:ferredoxin-NADP reductase/Na+-translocating ferredoxin:NAD+ oxidoreductase RnfD subunit